MKAWSPLYKWYLSALLFTVLSAGAQTKTYTHADTLKGSISRERSWWDATHYELHVSFSPSDSSIRGYTTIRYTVLEPGTVMQIDLMEPMLIDSVVQDQRLCRWRRDGNAFFVTNAGLQVTGDRRQVRVYFHGKPRRARLPPWEGGVIWSRDTNGDPWVAIACQGMSASVWFPNKDHQYDEVDSVAMFFTAPKELVSVSNGRLRSKTLNGDGTATYNWAVVNPINNYNIVPYIGRYVHFQDTLQGLGGTLDLDFWVLENNLEKAKIQFRQVGPMLHCFEDWFGKYPFYEDGYKLVEAPFLGMEHQSAIAYGNKYKNGYRGQDLSLTGWGLKWDFIIVHESGHEWFANSITAKDVADNWIHEGFTAYAENLYVERMYGKEAGAAYVVGTRNAVENDRPIIGDYGVNRDGSGDMYYKAANMLHTMRQLVNNDSAWKALMRGLNTTFWHQTVSTRQVEDYMSASLKMNLQKVFDQYLRTTQIPVLEYSLARRKLKFRWTSCVPGFAMPLRTEGANAVWIYPTEEWQEISYVFPAFVPDRNFYIQVKSLE